MLDSREPPRGDFVAYVEKIEREQLARALQPQRLPQPTAAGGVVSGDAPGDSVRALSAGEAQRLLQNLKAQGTGVASAPRGAMIGVVIGAALIAFGLMAEGGVVLVLLGAVLLWHNLRTLRRASRPPPPLPVQQVDRAFGSKPSSAAAGRRSA